MQALNAQIPDALETRLRGKERLADIMREVDDYYRQRQGTTPVRRQEPAEEDLEGCKECKEGADREYQHWKRWEYFHRSRLTDDGRVQNVAARNFLEGGSQRSGGANLRTAAVFSGAWSFRGPNNNLNASNVPTGVARVNALAFHPTDANTIWAATSSGGVYKTGNGGTSWYSISDEVSSLGAADVAVDYTNPNVLYVLTGDGESNNGSNWFVQAYGYLRFSTGVLKSTDGGNSWQKTGLTFQATQFNVGFRLSTLR